MNVRGGLARAFVGIAISAVALFLVVRGVDLAAAWETLRAADPRWIVLLLAFVACDVLLRAVRWRLLLAPIAAVALRDTLASILVGYLANNLLPARLGEVVRSHDLGTRTGVSRSTVLGTIVVERAVDTVVVVAVAALAILVLSVRGIVASAVLVGVALTALLLLAIAAAVWAHRLPGADRAAAFVARWPQVEGVLSRLRDGLAIAGRPQTMAAAGLLSAGSWTCTVLAFAAAAQAVGIEPTIGQAALLAAGTNLATAVPAAPGYVGTFELAAVTIARSVAVPAEPALAFAVLVHATTLLLTSIGGAAAFAAGGGRRRSADRSAEASTTPGGQVDAPAEAAVARRSAR